MIIKQIFSLYILRVISSLSGLLVIIYALFFNTSFSYGEYSILLYTVLLISNLVSGFFEQVFMKYKLDYQPFLILLLSVVFGLAFTWIYPSFNMFISLGMNLLITVSISYYSWLRSRLMNNQVIRLETYRFLLFILGIAILHSLGMVSVLNFVFVFSFSYIISFYSAFKQQEKSGRIIKKAHLNYGLTLSVWIALGTLFNYVDRYFILNVLNTDDLDKYSLIYDTVLKASAIFVIPLSTSLHPLLLSSENSWDSDVLIKARFPLVGTSLILIMIALTLPVVLEIDTIEIYVISILLSFAFIFWNIGIILQKKYEFHNKHQVLLMYLLICLIVNIFINISYLETYGLIVAAVSSLVGSLLYLIFILMRWRSLR